MQKKTMEESCDKVSRYHVIQGSIARDLLCPSAALARGNIRQCNIPLSTERTVAYEYSRRMKTLNETPNIIRPSVDAGFQLPVRHTVHSYVTYEVQFQRHEIPALQMRRQQQE